MELLIAAGIAALLGAVGGVIHLILPESNPSPANAYYKRIAAGAIAGAVVGVLPMQAALDAASDPLTVAAVGTIIATGYAGLDVVREIVNRGK